MVYALQKASTSIISRLERAFLGWCLFCGLLLSGASNGHALRIFQPSSWSRLESQECPESCKDVFQKLEDGPTVGGGMVQQVEVQERGEPKSGTGFMFEWAVGALAHSCMYLQSAYGRQSCRIESSYKNRTLIFDPHLAADDPGPCACEDVGRVTITMGNFAKHTLPVEDDCNWSRRRSIAKIQDTSCATHPGGNGPRTMDELWECVKTSACQLTDDRLQMAVMRDPRAVAVSAYFHALREQPQTVKGLTVDEYALALLPIVCQWVSIRYLLFSEILSTTSQLFWYDDAKANPMQWHRQLLSLVGLRLPDTVVSKATGAAEQGGHILGFPAKGVDKHVGGLNATATRSFTDEVTAATLKTMNSELQLWLPAAVLKHLGLAAEYR